MKVACEEKVEREAEDDDKCMSFTQKCIAYCFGFVDVLLHTMLIFGWSALTALYKKENYYRYFFFFRLFCSFIQISKRITFSTDFSL